MVVTQPNGKVEFCVQQQPLSSENGIDSSVKRNGNQSDKNGADESTNMLEPRGKVLTLSTMNPRASAFLIMEHAIFGPVINRAINLEMEIAEIKKNGGQPKFDALIKTNIGDAHAMGQKPLTFIREVLFLVTNPALIETCNYNEDVKRKAQSILNCCRGGSPGSYSETRGIEMIRKHVAKYIGERDGVPSDPENIVLTAGASQGILVSLHLFRTEGTNAVSSSTDAQQGLKIKKTGVLIPVPEYPIYSTALESYGVHKESGWTVNVNELEEIIDHARNECEPSAIVVINPGNPTGHVLPKETIQSIIRFAYKQRLVIIADEVYEHNVYAPRQFVSFKKVMAEMPAPFNSVELISVNSCSKGFTGECGLRGGYFEMVNLDPEVQSVLKASVATNLCPTVLGQTVMDCMVDPPKQGDPSYELFLKEKTTILTNLAERAEIIHRDLNAIPGVTCAQIDGAMYPFPRIHLPAKAVEAAKEAGHQPDVFYCLNLLEATGIIVNPGTTGTGQKPGTYHFRTTLLVPTDKIKTMLQKFRTFHLEFMSKYA